MAKVYVGDFDTVIAIDVGVDVSSATSLTIKYTKPDGTSGTWTGAAGGTDNVEIQYQTNSGDIDQAGEWLLQPYVEDITGAGGWDGLGEAVRLDVYDPYE
jgi:hypothetical protein